MPITKTSNIITAEVTKEELAQEIRQEQEEAHQRWLAVILTPLSNSFSTHRSWEKWLEQERSHQYNAIPARSE